MARPEFVLNLAPQHQFSALGDWPEAQLLMLVPQPIWAQAAAYVPQAEAVSLAGQYGANPGDFEWEVLEQPPGFKWLRRTIQGIAYYYGFAVTPNPSASPVEVYGMIDIGSDTEWWFDGADDISAILHQSESIVRLQGGDLEAIRFQMSLNEYRRRELLTAEPAGGEPAWRLGAELEVRRFKDALIGLLERARKAG
jgi:hypothetical protein